MRTSLSRLSLLRAAVPARQASSAPASATPPAD
jgi:hypothetical protein